MNIEINYSYRKDDLRKYPFGELALFTLMQEECPETTEVSVSFVDNEEMTKLNESYRGKVGPTDVLSFECDGLDDDEFEEEGFYEGSMIPEDEPYLLGDIVIAPDIAEHQCVEFGNTFIDELNLLLVHGLLHLCGYDHLEDEEAREMEARELEILRAWSETQA